MLRQVSLAFLIIPKLAGRMWCPAEEQKAQHRNEATIVPLFPFSHNSTVLGGSVLFKRFKISPAFVVHFGVGGWLWMVGSPSARCHTTVYNHHFFTTGIFACYFLGIFIHLPHVNTLKSHFHFLICIRLRIHTHRTILWRNHWPSSTGSTLWSVWVRVLYANAQQ